MEPLETITARVVFIVRHCGVNPSHLAHLAGLSKAHVRHLLDGRIVNPTSETCVAIARVCGVPTDWLLMGRGSVPDPDAIKRHVETVDLGYQNAKRAGGV